MQYPLTSFTQFGIYSSTVVDTYVSFSLDIARDLIVSQHYWWQLLAKRCFRLGDRYQVSPGKFYLILVIEIFSLFYMPGTIGGAFVVDYLGPKYTMVWFHSPCGLCCLLM